MWTLRQRLQPFFRTAAGVVLPLWLMATVVCAMHCAGLFGTGTGRSGSCCHRDVSFSTSSNRGTASHHQPSGPSKADGSGCLKEYVAGKPSEITALQAAIAPQIPWPTILVVQPPVAASFFTSSVGHTRRSSPALMLGRGLRVLAPPSRLA